MCSPSEALFLASAVLIFGHLVSNQSTAIHAGVFQLMFDGGKIL